MASSTYTNLLSQPYYQYGDFKVTGDWKYTQAQQTNGQNYLTFFDPSNTSSNFTLNAQNVPEYLTDYVRDAKGQLNNAVVDPLASGFYSAGAQGAFTPNQNLYGFDSGQFYLTPDYQSLLRNRNVSNQISSGQLSVQQGEQMANAPMNVATPTLAAAQAYVPPTPGSGMTYADRVRTGQTNQARTGQTSTPSQGLSFNDIAANQQGLSRDQLAQRAQTLAPITQVNLTPSTQTTSTQLSNPKTAFDIQSILTQNQSNYNNFIKQQQQLQQQYLNALKPDPATTKLQQQLNDLKNQMLNTDLSAQAGILDAKQKLMPMRAIIGEQQNIVEQANLKLKTLAAMQSPLVDQLQLAQSIRTQQLKGLETMMSFGLQNYRSGQEQLEFLLSMNKYQRELDQLAKSEQQAAKEFALQYGVDKPFYDVGGTIYRSSDGKAYSSPEEFFADGGSKDWSNVDKVEVAPEAPTSDIAEYEYAQQQGFDGSFLDYLSKRTSATSRSTSRSTRRSPNSDFTDSQLSKGAAAAGMSITDFTQLSEDEQNQYIYGAGGDLVGGRLDDSDFTDFQDEIDDMFEEGLGLGEVRAAIDESTIPQDDKEELKQYAEEAWGDYEPNFFENVWDKIKFWD